MKRRDFIKYSSLMVPAAAAIGMIGPFSKKIYAAGMSRGAFSVAVITDQPSRTIHTIEQAIKNSGYANGDLQFTEYKLNGSHIGDIAYVKSNKLIDYHKRDDEFSMMLDESAHSLELPRKLDNPILLRFSSQNNLTVPSGINIFRSSSLISYLSLNEDGEHRIDGLKGHVDISIKDKSVKIISATCKHKTCMTMAPISKPGENLICIPNQINVAIGGKSRFGVDSITF